MAIRWASSADKHGISHEHALYAMGHAVHAVTEFDRPRTSSGPSPTLYIGPAGPGGHLVEILVVLTPPRDLFVFHVMPLRRMMAERAEFDLEVE